MIWTSKSDPKTLSKVSKLATLALGLTEKIHPLLPKVLQKNLMHGKLGRCLPATVKMAKHQQVDWYQIGPGSNWT